VLLICPGVFVDNAEWTGVPVAALLGKAGLQPNSSEVVFYDGDQYQKSFFLKDIIRDGVFLAYNVDGQPLPKEHGFPLRLVVKGVYGNTWVKWIDRIEIK
jgi:sulfane dehydrogenase subunit SoxC